MALAEILELANGQADAEEAIKTALGLYRQKGNLASAARASARLAGKALAE
jgi:hypothetical protein